MVTRRRTEGVILIIGEGGDRQGSMYRRGDIHWLCYFVVVFGQIDELN